MNKTPQQQICDKRTTALAIPRHLSMYIIITLVVLIYKCISWLHYKPVQIVFSFKKLTIHCRRVILQSKCCFQRTEDFAFFCFSQLSPNGWAFFERVVLHLHLWSQSCFKDAFLISMFLTTIARRYNSWNSSVKTL